MRDENVHGEEKEKEEALKHACYRRGYGHRDLGRFSTDVGQRKKQPGDKNAEGMEAAEKGDDDGCEAIANRDSGHKLTHRASCLEGSREPSATARNQKANPDEPVR
jgi:hypothetical protein